MSQARSVQDVAKKNLAVYSADFPPDPVAVVMRDCKISMEVVFYSLIFNYNAFSYNLRRNCREKYKICFEIIIDRLLLRGGVRLHLRVI